MSFFNRKNKDIKKPDYGGMRNTVTTRADWSLLTSEAVYAAVSRISNQMAMLPLHLYKNQDIAKDDPLEKLLNYMPNATMTPYVFKQTLEAFRNTEGNAYALIVTDPSSHQVASLDVLDASKVNPMRAQESKEMWYQFPLDNGQTAMVHSSNMLVFHHLSANGERGIRPLDVLRGTLSYTEKVREFSLQQIEGVNHGVVLELPNTGLGSERRDQLVAGFIETYKKSGGKVMVLEGGMHATTLNQNPVNAAVLDVERINKNRVATVYSIPPHMMGDYSNATYSTAEQAQREFLNMTILPIVKHWQEELNLKLLTWEQMRAGYEFRFDLNEMLKADSATTSERYQRGVRGGWMRVNEVRQMEGLPPVEGGDMLFMSRDLAPMEFIANEGLHAAPVAGGSE